MRPEGRTAEMVIAGIAARQFGVVTRGQLADAGVTAAEVKHRAAAGALIRVHRGVYRVGHAAPSVAAQYLAAVLACGEGALLAGPAAAWWSGLVKGEPAVPHVVAPRQVKVSGVMTTCCRSLNKSDGRTWRGIPTTTPARTLTDLAPILPLDALARACHEAGVLHRVKPGDVQAVIARRGNVKGAAKLRAVMSGDERVSLSALERRFLDVLRRERLPLPRTNKVASGRRVDCKWPGLTVELDSFRFHNSRHTWEQDRRREREAYARGDQFRRYTWGDVFEHPRQMLAELCALLAEGRRDRAALDEA